MTCRPCLRAASILDEASEVWPNRNRSSDGTCASAAHSAQNPTSDHEPDADGLAHAVDTTHDPTNGPDVHGYFRSYLTPAPPSWMKYAISNREILNPAVAPYWRPYSGSNPHDKHGHLSIYKSGENDVSPFWRAQTGGDLTVDQADRIIETLGVYEQDTRKYLGGLIVALDTAARNREGRRTRRILEAIEAGRTTPEEIARLVAADDGDSASDVVAKYDADLYRVAAHLDSVVVDDDSLDTPEKVRAAVHKAKSDLDALAGK